MRTRFHSKTAGALFFFATREVYRSSKNLFQKVFGGELIAEDAGSVPIKTSGLD